MKPGWRKHAGGLLLLVGVLVAWPGAGAARRTKTIAFIPDPSCRGHKLAEEVEATLADHLKVERVEIVTKKKTSAAVLLQYFILVRKSTDQATVQVDARAFENRSGKFLAEGSATSDPHPDEPDGHAAAARQATRDLALELSDALGKSLWEKGRGRRVMIQITVEPEAGLTSRDVLARLRKALPGADPGLRGSTDRNITVVIDTAESTQDLVASIQQALAGPEALAVDWVVKARNSLILRLGEQPP